MESNFDKYSLKDNCQISFEKKYIISKKKNNNTPGDVLNFDILSSPSEINSCNFDLVDEKFFIQNYDRSLYTNKHVYIFEINGKKFIHFPNENISLEIKINQENNIECKASKDVQKSRIRNVAQLYIEEENILALFDENIKKEKFMNEYYLINKNWIDFYEGNTNYKKIEGKLKSMDIKNLNLEEFVNTNFNDISNGIKDLSENFLKEEHFYPHCNKLESSLIEEQNDLSYPHEFILVSENLFNLIYKEIINPNKYKKDDYKYKTIIGDNVLFIQDKNHDNIFYAFTKEKNNNKHLFSFFFKYNDKNMFFDDIKNYIQNKGFYNYLIERNIYFHTKPKLDLLYNQDNEKIGKYISYKK